MNDKWDRLAEASDGDYSREEFETALYRLITEQVLYAADRRSRASYKLVDQYESEFSDQLGLVGAELKVNRQMRYAVAVSRHTKLGNASVEETLVALLLRKLQDEAIQRGEMTEEGEVYCELATLSERYRLETNRVFPDKGRLDLILRALKRYGIVRIVDEDDGAPVTTTDVEQPYTLAIRPAIAEVLGEGALMRLAQWKPGSDEVSLTATAAVDKNAEAA